jgi:uncharacterized membrane protein
VSSTWRYLGCAVGFGVGVVWMTVGIGSAILVLLCAGLGYGVAFVAERERGDWSKLRRPGPERPVEDEPLLGEAFELDHIEFDPIEERREELPEPETAPVAAGVDYGWPSAS